MMFSGEDEDIKALQKRINLNINELEIRVKQHKLICHYYGQESNKMFVQHLIQSHYGEIVYHINQIRYHLEQINSHRKALQELETTDTKVNLSKDNQNESQDGNPIKRTEEDKLRSKMRRVTRASSLKYVQQWEKMLEEQKDDNFLNIVKRKWKSQDILDATEVSSGEAFDNDVSKTMVKNRIQKFEGFNKPKRASSTVEAFLDLNVEKGNFTRRSVITEDVVQEARRSHEFGDYYVANNNSSVKVKQEELGNKSITTEVDIAKELQESKLENEETVESTKYETEDEEAEDEEDEITDVLEEIKSCDSISLDISSEDMRDDFKETNKPNVSTKPIIVGIHLKQSSTDI